MATHEGDHPRSAIDPTTNSNVSVVKKELSNMSRGMKTRSRQLNQTVTYGAVFQRYPGEGWSQQRPTVDREFLGSQVTESEGHRRSKNGVYMEGGPFFTARISHDIGVRHVNHDILNPSDGIQYKYIGPLTCGYVPSDAAEIGRSIPDPNLNSLDTWGAKAVAAVDPTNANADLGVALGEFITERRLPLPVISSWRRRTELAKAAGSEYLSAVFGWLPLVGEMKSTAQSVRDGNHIMENYVNHSGTKIHREFEFPPITSNSVETISENGYARINGNAWFGPGGFTLGQKVTRSTTSTTRRWFSGSFTYAASDSKSIANCIGLGSEAEKLFGLTLSPDVIWNLTPWSWAADWFSNAGTVVSNVSSFGPGGLVMPYGYIMEETSIVDTYTMSGTGIKGLDGTVPPHSINYTIKKRQEANPFGFGLSWDGLSPSQLAVTAALGITRLR